MNLTNSVEKVSKERGNNSKAGEVGGVAKAMEAKPTMAIEAKTPIAMKDFMIKEYFGCLVDSSIVIYLSSDLMKNSANFYSCATYWIEIVTKQQSGSSDFDVNKVDISSGGRIF
jgi:hypothetical protein